MRKFLLTATLLLTSTLAFAEDGGNKTSFMYLGYVLAVAIAAYGGTASQSRAASVALEGIARNPSAADKIQTPMILALALMESLVIFTLITIFFIK
jgi:F-type H+-transporting ATPase subunit c